MQDLPDPDAPPCCAALLAATLTLMTVHAEEPAPGARLDGPAQRRVMARKIASNLFFLAHHPGLPPPLRTVVARLQLRWAGRGAAEAAVVPARIDEDRAPAGPLH